MFVKTNTGKMDKRIINKYKLFCITESNYVYTWSDTEPTSCPEHPTHEIDLSSMAVIDTVHKEQQQIIGQWIDNRYYNARITNDGKLCVDTPTSAFGLVKTENDYPQVQMDFRYGLCDKLSRVTTSNQGSVWGSNCMAHVASGSTSNSQSTLESLRFLRYAPGQGGNIMFAGSFSQGVPGNTQIIGAGTQTNGLFYGYNNTDFGILHRRNGTDTWITQSNWNIDKMDGTGPSKQTINPTKGNVYRISFQWLGYGAIVFLIEESSTGKFLPVHRIQYANKNDVPTLFDPSFPMWLNSKNTTNTSNVVCRTSSFCAMLEGQPSYFGLTFGVDNTKTISTTTITNVLSVRCKQTYKNIDHHIQVFMKQISLGFDGNKNAVVYLIINPTIGGVQSWQNVNIDDSCMEYDTTGTTVTGGQQIAVFTFAKLEARDINLHDMNIMLYPGYTITCGVRLASIGSTECSASMTWLEER